MPSSERRRALGPGPYRSARPDRAPSRRGRDVQGAVFMVVLIGLGAIGLVTGAPSRGLAVVVSLGLLWLLVGGRGRSHDV